MGRAHPPLAVRCATAGLVALSLLLAPSPALAQCLDADEIAGRPLAACDPSHTVAPDISAFSGALYAGDGRALWSRRIDRPHAMASTTKIMTALIALERANLDDVVTISEHASKVPYALGLQPGERLTVRQLVELALVASSNDAAIALGELVNGSESGFVATMNERAAELGLDDTHFANPHGLDQPGHYTSAADLASLTRTAMKLPEFQRVVSIRKLKLAERKDRPARTLKSTNQLLRTYPGIVGGKTGFTDDAKYALVATAQRDDVKLTAVILGAPNSGKRFKTSARLLDWGFKHLRPQTLTTPTETVGAVALSANPSRSVPARFAEETSMTLFDLDGPVTRKLQLAAQLPLPIFEGQPVGTVRLMQGERVLATATAVAALDVASVGETVGAVPVADYIDRVVTVRAAETSSAVQEFTPDVPLRRVVDLDPSVAAPVTEGTTVGEIVYLQGEQVVSRVPVVTATAVEAPGRAEKLGIWLMRGVRGLFGAPRMADAVVTAQ